MLQDVYQGKCNTGGWRSTCGLPRCGSISRRACCRTHTLRGGQPSGWVDGTMLGGWMGGEGVCRGLEAKAVMKMVWGQLFASRRSSGRPLVQLHVSLSLQASQTCGSRSCFGDREDHVHFVLLLWLCGSLGRPQHHTTGLLLVATATCCMAWCSGGRGWRRIAG